MCEVHWSEEDREYVATCTLWPSLSWLSPDRLAALGGLADLIYEEKTAMATAALKRLDEGGTDVP